MGEGLKRIAPRPGGLTVRGHGRSVRHNSGGQRLVDKIYAYSFTTPDSPADDGRADLVVLMPTADAGRARAVAARRLRDRSRPELVGGLRRVDTRTVPLLRDHPAPLLEPTVVYDTVEHGEDIGR